MTREQRIAIFTAAVDAAQLVLDPDKSQISPELAYASVLADYEEHIEAIRHLPLEMPHEFREDFGRLTGRAEKENSRIPDRMILMLKNTQAVRVALHQTDLKWGQNATGNLLNVATEFPGGILRKIQDLVAKQITCCDRFALEGQHHVECELWDGHNG